MQNKVCIITGASGGIGAEISEMLFSLGIRPVLMGRNEEKLAEVAKGRECLILPGDIRDDSYIEETVIKTVSEYGGIDFVINNAGIAHSTPFEEVTMEEYDRIMDINARAPFLLCKTALPYLKKSDCGTVINIASVTAHKGYPLQSVYAASKHALLGFSKSLAKECCRENVRVHVISPGGVYTDMIKISRPDLTSDGMILPKDIAETVRYIINMRKTAAVPDEIELHREAKEPFI